MILTGYIHALLECRIAFRSTKVMVNLVAKTPFDRQLAEFFAQFDVRDSVLLTPNKRLSRFFIDQYAKKQTSRAFVSLPCLALNVWLLQLWQDLEFIDEHPQASYTLLSSFHESLLWESTLEQHPQTPALINTRATARQAQSAWRLVHEWQLALPMLSSAAQALGDPFIFGQWYTQFENTCQHKQYFTSAQLPGFLQKRINALLNQSAPQDLAQLRRQAGPTGLLAKRLPGTIYLYGFDELNPATRALLATLASIGISITNLELQVAQNVTQRFEFANEEQELKAVARWAKQQVAALPSVTLGIVIPNLPAQRSRVERIFMHEFEPQYIFSDQMQHSTGFNISTGEPLAQVPVVAAGLAALNCYAQRLNLQQMSLLLLSPFIGVQEELSYRAQWEAALRLLGELQLSFQQFKTFISENGGGVNCQTTSPSAAENKTADIATPSNIPLGDFYQRISDFDQLRKTHKSIRRHPSQWCTVLLDQLGAWGWPGNRQLDTLEYQQVQSFLDLLNDFAGLDNFLGSVNQAKALEVLTVLLNQTPFHAQTRQSPVQILGLLEAAGLAFDEIWVLGLDDDTWPPAAKPNPLLPIKLQRELNLPQSSPEREIHFAQQLTLRLAQCCTRLNTSSASSKGDKQLSASPLISSFVQAQLPTDEQLSFQHTLFASRQITSSLDFCGPQIGNTDVIRGGAQILKSQATCPFQAFARYRLHTSEISVPGIGLSAQERGNLTHRIMEIIWRILKDQAHLLALDDDKLIVMINKACTQALMEVSDKQVAGVQFLQLEAARLSAQVLRWLELEKLRTPFKVLFNEGRKSLKLGKMPLHIRYDRVDELADGTLLVLDYKTGANTLNDWAGMRPNEPQVPLYAIANSKRVAGAAFGQISADAVNFNGIAADNTIAPGLCSAEKLPRLDLPKDWQEILQHWENVLARLAREFLAGFAAVDPKHPPTSCRHCQLHALCRIREQFDFDRHIEPDEEPISPGEASNV